MNSKIRRAVASALATAGLTGAVMVMAAPPALADGVGHSLKMTTSSKTKDEVYVCKDWSGSTIRSDCPSASRYLPVGKSTTSYLGWSDTDGARVPNGWQLKCDVAGPDIVVYANRSGGTRWVKMSPYSSCLSASVKPYLVRNP